MPRYRHGGPAGNPPGMVAAVIADSELPATSDVDTPLQARLAVRWMRVLTRRPMLAVYVGALLVALVMAALQPAWAVTDEAAHADFADQLAHMTYPRMGDTPIRPETLQLMETLHLFHWDRFHADPVVEDATFGPAPRGLEPLAQAVWARRHQWQMSYEAMQPPLVYAAAAPLWALGNVIAGPVAALYVLRVANALLAAALAPIAYATALTLMPGRRRIAVTAGVLAVLVPGAALNLTSFTNDTSAAVLGATAFLLAARLWRNGWSRSRFVPIGASLAMAYLAKPTGLGVLPGVLILVLTARPRMCIVARARAVGLVLAIAALGPLAFFVITHVINGTWTTEAGWERVSPYDVSMVHHGATEIASNVRNAFTTWFDGEPSDLTSAVNRIILSTGGVATLAAVLMGLTQRHRSCPSGRIPTLALGGAIVGSLVVSLALPILARAPYPSPGRYMYASLPAFSVLAAVGLEWAVRSARMRAAILTVTAAGCAGALVILPSALTVGRRADPVPIGPRMPLSGVGTPTLAGLVLSADQVSTTPGLLMLHVVAHNAAPTAVEWDPRPFSAADTYGDSLGIATTAQTLVETLLPGETASGWVSFPRRAEQDLSRVVIYYYNITDISYRHLEDASLVVLIPGEIGSDPKNRLSAPGRS